LPSPIANDERLIEQRDSRLLNIRFGDEGGNTGTAAVEHNMMLRLAQNHNTSTN